MAKYHNLRLLASGASQLVLGTIGGTIDLGRATLGVAYEATAVASAGVRKLSLESKRIVEPELVTASFGEVYQELHDDQHMMQRVIDGRDIIKLKETFRDIADQVREFGSMPPKQWEPVDDQPVNHNPFTAPAKPSPVDPATAFGGN